MDSEARAIFKDPFLSRKRMNRVVKWDKIGTTSYEPEVINLGKGSAHSGDFSVMIIDAR